MRKYIRHPAQIPIEIVREFKHSSCLEHLSDISYGGLKFDSRVCLPKGNHIVIRISLADESYEINGHIVWCNKKEEGCEIGVEFSGESEAFRVRMVEQVCHIEQYRKQVLEEEGRELSSQEAAFEWINKFAQKFPELS